METTKVPMMGLKSYSHRFIYLSPVEDLQIDTALREGWTSRTSSLKLILCELLQSGCVLPVTAVDWTGLLARLEEIRDLQTVILRFNDVCIDLEHEIKSLWETAVQRIWPYNTNLDLRTRLFTAMNSVRCGVDANRCWDRRDFVHTRSVFLNDKDNRVIRQVLLEQWYQQSKELTSILDDIMSNRFQIWTAPEDLICLDELMVDLLKTRGTISRFDGTRVCIPGTEVVETLDAYISTLLAITANAHDNTRRALISQFYTLSFP